MPIGNVPYHHRRKYSSQVQPDYQSRIFFGEFMRENRIRVGASATVNGNPVTSSTSSSSASSSSSSSSALSATSASQLTASVSAGCGDRVCTGTGTGEELYSVSAGSVSSSGDSTASSLLAQDICNSNTPVASSQCSTPVGSGVNNFGTVRSHSAHNGNGPISPVSPQQQQQQQQISSLGVAAIVQQPSAQSYLASALYTGQRIVPSGASVGGGSSVVESGVGVVSVSGSSICTNNNNNNNNNSSSNNNNNSHNGINNNNNTVDCAANNGELLATGGPNLSLSGASVGSRKNSCSSNDDVQHHNTTGPISSTNHYTLGGGSIDVQQQQQQQQQASHWQHPGQPHQQQQQQQQQQQSSSLSSSNSLINTNNLIKDRDSTNYVTTTAILTLGATVSSTGGGGGSGCGGGGTALNNNNNNHHHNSGNNLAVGASAVSSTMASSTAISPPRPMQKVIPTVVYLMSRIAVHMEIEGTAQCPAQVMLAAALGCEELGITNKLLAQSVFGLWMTSPLLEVQLKPHHRPYAVRVAWSKLLDKHSHRNELEKLSDEPMTMLRRNVFFPRKDEEKIKDPRLLELLYEEARHNVLLGRYVMESSHSIMLGGIQARIELGPYNSHTHSTSYFRENQFRFLPAHVAKSSSWSWLPISRRTSAEVRLLEQFKRVPTTATTKKLMRKYLEFCWGLPFYGAAYFHGQVEQPARGLVGLMQQKDLPVLIAVNERGIYVIDQIECTLLLGLRYEELSWDYAKPSNVNDPECLPCIFLQFGAVENGIAATKLMQIFTRQAAMIDALITHFIEQAKRRKESGEPEVPAGENQYEAEPNLIQNNGMGVLSNKLSRLTLATFDDEGRCIGQMGSLSISY